MLEIAIFAAATVALFLALVLLTAGSKADEQIDKIRRENDHF